MRLFSVFCLTMLAFAAASCHKAPPANVAAEVNGRPITYTDLDKTYQSQYPQTPEGSNKDQESTNKLELLNSMITDEILTQRAERLGLQAVDADVEAEINKIKAPYTKEDFDKKLAERHMTIDDLRAQKRREITLTKLINKEITSRITVTDADIAEFFNANKEAFNRPEPTIRIAQILVTGTPDPNVRNLNNSKAQNDREARAKIEDIAARLTRGEDFATLARSFSEDPNTAPNGGDMGPIPESNLDKAGAELKKLVLSLRVGEPSKIIPGPGDYRILKVLGREPAGQRDLNDPRVHQEIHEMLFNRKDQLLKAAYYEVARNSAKVENYLARNIAENPNK
jgi:peptidyl-prolyl cis-trans isomerase SurA